MFQPSNWHWVHNSSYFPETGVPDNKITFLGFSLFNINLVLLALLFLIQLLSSNIKVKFSKFASSGRLQTKS